jgi:hypothetical protein
LAPGCRLVAGRKVVGYPDVQRTRRTDGLNGYPTSGRRAAAAYPAAVEIGREVMYVTSAARDIG